MSSVVVIIFAAVVVLAKRVWEMKADLNRPLETTGWGPTIRHEERWDLEREDLPEARAITDKDVRSKRNQGIRFIQTFGLAIGLVIFPFPWILSGVVQMAIVDLTGRASWGLWLITSAVGLSILLGILRKVLAIVPAGMMLVCQSQPSGRVVCFGPGMAPKLMNDVPTPRAWQPLDLFTIRATDTIDASDGPVVPELLFLVRASPLRMAEFYTVDDEDVESALMGRARAIVSFIITRIRTDEARAGNLFLAHQVSKLMGIPTIPLVGDTVHTQLSTQFSQLEDDLGTLSIGRQERLLGVQIEGFETPDVDDTPEIRAARGIKAQIAAFQEAGVDISQLEPKERLRVALVLASKVTGYDFGGGGAGSPLGTMIAENLGGKVRK